MKTYEFPTYLVTTDEVLDGALREFEITSEEATAILEGATPEIIEGDLIVDTSDITIQ